MTGTRLRDALERGEALRYETVLRTGGRLGVSDERVLIAQNDEIETVPLENVKEVIVQPIDWFLVVLSVALAGVGGYGIVEVGDPLLGFAFVVAAVANLWLTYRKRGRIAVRLHAGGKPVVAYVDGTEDVEAALRRAIESFESAQER